VTRILSSAALAVGLCFAGPAGAENCANTNALGTWRTIQVDPVKLGRIGTMQYRETIALAPKEIVLTFDDGPMPPMTSKVLDALRSECVRATFFLIGRNARAHPEIVRTIARDGHTVANHTENHLLFTMPEARGMQEIDAGFRSIAAALEPMGASPAPFFRFPGLLSSHAVEQYAKRKGVAVFSADFLADDWMPISADQVLARGLARMGQKNSGVMLLHDVEPATALALPRFLNELKTRGYRIVHLVPAYGAAVIEPPMAEKPAPAPQVAEKRPPAPVRTPAPKPQRVEEPAAPTIGIFGRWQKRWQTRHTAAAPAALSVAP
jgi:peptidoglycan/xylan/chitin deacetylase (PgdA/CDA1 family)